VVGSSASSSRGWQTSTMAIILALALAARLVQERARRSGSWMPVC
jgi:hypothetical protein